MGIGRRTEETGTLPVLPHSIQQGHLGGAIMSIGKRERDKIWGELLNTLDQVKSQLDSQPIRKIKFSARLAEKQNVPKDSRDTIAAYISILTTHKDDEEFKEAICEIGGKDFDCLFIILGLCTQADFHKTIYEDIREVGQSETHHLVDQINKSFSILSKNDTLQNIIKDEIRLGFLPGNTTLILEVLPKRLKHYIGNEINPEGNVPNHSKGFLIETLRFLFKSRFGGPHHRWIAALVSAVCGTLDNEDSIRGYSRPKNFHPVIVAAIESFKREL